MKNDDGLDVRIGRDGIARGVRWRERTWQRHIRRFPVDRRRRKLFGGLLDRDA